MQGCAQRSAGRINSIVPIMRPSVSMSASLDSPRYLLRWDFSNPQAVGRDLVLSSHRLADLSIISDTPLETLLRSIPRSQFSIHCIGDNLGHPNELQTGSMGAVSVGEAIEIIRRGRLAMMVRQIDHHDHRLANLATRLVGELCECHVGLRILEPQLEIAISSPGTRHYYRCDAQQSVLWQLHGQLKVWLYPREQRFLDQRDLERIVHQGCTQRLYYEPAFDARAEVTDVGPGQMIAWPHPSPYRIETLDDLSVTLRLTFQTPATRRQRNIHLANRALRGWALDRICSDQTGGFWATAKNLSAELLKLHEFNRQNDSGEPTFVLDPSRSSGIRLCHEPTHKELADSVSLNGMVAAGFKLPGAVSVPTVIPEN
jgi:hypothetical protein